MAEQKTNTTSKFSLKPEQISASTPAKDRGKRNAGKCGCMRGISSKITSSMEHAFHRWGQIVSRWPWTTIILSLVVCGILSGGMLLWYQEKDEELLWTPYKSPFIEQKAWIAENFPRDRRFENLIMVGENVLTADTVRYFVEMDRRIREYKSADNLTMADLCFRYPETGGLGPCVSLGVFGSFSKMTDQELDHLTDDQVLDMITQMYSAGPIDQFLSGITFSLNGQVTGAKALLNIWLLKDNATNPFESNEDAKDWENGFIDAVITDPPTNMPEGLEVFGLAERSYNDEIDYVVNSNIPLLMAGFGLLFLYIMVVLGNFNWIEQRALLSIAGMIVIGLALGASFGLCFYLSISFNDICPIIPFLLLGIGVDDMFVIVQCLDNLEKVDGETSEERVAKAMKHAGVSITVTSFTDAAAFYIGATTSMPILRSFCYFAGTGVVFLYIFAITFFVACLVLDERRKISQISRRPDWNPSPWTRSQPGKYVFKNWISPVILKWPVSVLVLVVTVALAAGGAYGLANIESDYDSIWYMRHESYQYRYYKELADNFRGQGERVEVYIGNIDYETNQEELQKMSNSLSSNAYVREDSVQFWYQSFIDSQAEPQESFMESVGIFLTKYPEYLQDIKLNISINDADVEDFFSHLIAGQFSINATRANFQHKALDNTTIRNKAMDTVKDAMDQVDLTGSDFKHPIPYTFMYVQWEANRIISKQLIRNLSLAFGVIALVNILLIADLVVSVLVFLCVALTLLEIAGGAYFMGLTIEIVTSIVLLLSVGLALDYAAHIGVTYIVTKGTNRKEKTQETLSSMGMAVANGGISTLLAFVLVAFSNSYVYLTFFKMFVCVVVFGLFHGLFFLPVVLGLIGSTDDPEDDEDDNCDRGETINSKL